jgi:DNA-3-methyladenine glycosylase II
MQFNIPLPDEFSFDLCLSFLQRSPKELLHRCQENSVRKLLRVEGNDVLFQLTPSKDHELQIDVLNGKISLSQKNVLINYVREWFDLDTDLKPFYAMAAKDRLLESLITKYRGYRIVGQPDLFESLVWAVLGQQINVQFAYTLKQRFVEKFGSKLIFDNEEYFMFPTADTVSLLSDEHLLPLQFSRQKSKYTVLIAEAFASNRISKEMVRGLPLQQAKELLMTIKGVGNWTANYALMKTFRYPDAFPLEDAGIHNAIKNLRK